MAGSAYYNIVYMSERVGTSNTYRVTGGDRTKTGKNNSPVIKKRRAILFLLIQTKENNSLCCIYLCFYAVVTYYWYVLWEIQ